MKKKIKQSTKRSIMQFDLNTKRLGKKISENSLKEKRAVIYCRVSDSSQVTKGFGLEGQERVCRDWCDNQTPPIQIEQVFIEPGISGAKTNRKEFDKCLHFLDKQNKKQQTITHFVVSEASRISRPEDITEAFMMEASIKATGVKIVSLDMPGIDESSDEGHLFKTISYAIAGYERKKIKKRAFNGKLNRLKDGYRPFNKVAVGYLRVREGPKCYEDIIDHVKGPIVKQGLEMFANDVLLTQADLWRYWVSKGLRSNIKNAKTLPRTFPEKVFQLHRLFYYAGHIYYPEWGINEPIKAKHEGLITLKTALTIIEKIQKIHKNYNKPKLKTNKMTNSNPLRGVVICPYCERRFTSWNTTKYRTKNGQKIKKIYPYYGCANPNCDKKVYIRKEVLENEFVSILEKMKLSTEVKSLIEKVFVSTWNKDLKTKVEMIAHNKKNIKSIESRQEQIEELLIRTSNYRLCEKLEIEWGELDKEREMLTEKLSNAENSEETMKKLMDKTIELFQNPIELRRKGSSTMRQLLIKVRFGDHLYYTKEDGLRTTENAVLYALMVNFTQRNPFVRQAGEKVRTFNKPTFEKLTTSIQANSIYINAILNRIEYENKFKSEENKLFNSTIEPP